MSWLTPWKKWLRKRRAKRAAERLEHRRSVLRAQIAARRAKHQQWRPLLGSLKDATTEALRVENQLVGD